MCNPAKMSLLFISAAAKCRLNTKYVYAIGNTHIEAPGKVGPNRGDPECRA